MRHLFAIMLAIFAMAAVACAQSPEGGIEALPPGPLIQLRAPEFARWVITCNPKKAGESTKYQFSKRIVVTKTKDIRHEEITDESGHITEKWCCCNSIFWTDPLEKKRIALGNSIEAAGDLYVNYSKTDFPGTEWISASNYSEIKSFVGQDCIVFKERRTGDQESSSVLPNADSAVVYVDLKTRLPVYLQRGGEIRIYQFEAPPQVMLALPLDIQQMLERDKKHKEEMAQMPAKPF